MKKAYFSISYQNRKNLQPEITTIQKILSDFTIELFIFIDNCHFSPREEKQMMRRAFCEIDSSDFIIAEVSEKAIGVGIEIGYAIGKNKPVIYLRNVDSEHSTTAAGSAQDIIIYQTPEDLSEKIKQVLTSFKI